MILSSFFPKVRIQLNEAYLWQVGATSLPDSKWPKNSIYSSLTAEPSNDSQKELLKRIAELESHLDEAKSQQTLLMNELERHVEQAAAEAKKATHIKPKPEKEPEEKPIEVSNF